MAKKRSTPAAPCDHVVLLAARDAAEAKLLRAHLEGVPGRRHAAERGSYPRFRVIVATRGDEALRRASGAVTAAAVDLAVPRRNGLEVVQELRARRRDLAILVFTSDAPASEAVAAMMAGADFFHEQREGDLAGFERGLELAIDRRRLRRFIEESEAEVEASRGRLAQLSGDLARSLPGLRPPQSPEDVIPFEEAARRYLHAASRLYVGNARGLAARLGVSYYALRRLLSRYGVPFPRSPGYGTRPR
jgi:CheY-like chemotaxis protein